MNTREKTNQTKMFRILEQWHQTTNMTQKTFCEYHGISYKSFAYWKKKYASARGTIASEKINEPSAVSGFAPAQVLDLPFCLPGVEIVYPNSVRLIFDSGLDVAILKSLLKL